MASPPSPRPSALTTAAVPTASRAPTPHRSRERTACRTTWSLSTSRARRKTLSRTRWSGAPPTARSSGRAASGASHERQLLRPRQLLDARLLAQGGRTIGGRQQQCVLDRTAALRVAAGGARLMLAQAPLGVG